MKHIKPYSREALILLLTGICCLIHFRNVFAYLFNGDSSLYAEVAWEMFRKKDFLHLLSEGQPFLDKPHMFFWLSALSYSIFGVNAAAFKFPSFLALIGTLFSVYQFTKNYYDKMVAAYATLITASMLGVFFMTNDVRLDTVLTCFIISGIWFFSNYLLFKKWYYFLLAALCFSAAYYTKGAIGFIIPAVAFVPHALKYYPKKDGLKTIVVLCVTLSFFMVPLLIIAYYQFGWEGVTYFAWGHIAGRISGKSFSNNPDTFFVWHTMLWVVAPWTLFLLVGVWNKFKLVFKKDTGTGLCEIISISGLLLGLLLLSFSSYQLSHYVYPLIPFAAIIAAANSEPFWNNKFFIGLQSVVNAAAITIAAIIVFYITPGSIVYVVTFLVLALTFIYASKRKDIVIATAITAIALNFILSFLFFPTILKYQTNGELYSFLKSKEMLPNDLICLNVGSPYQFALYSEGTPTKYTDPATLLKEEKRTAFYVFTNQQGYNDMSKTPVSLTVEKRLFDFRVTKLTWKFLNPKTREDACEKLYVLKVVQH